MMEESKRDPPMAAMKEYALTLEINQAEAGCMLSTTRAYRLGMLEACRLITESLRYYNDSDINVPYYQALHETWDSIYDAITYLREVDQQD